MCWSIDESDVLAEMQGADQNVMATAGHQLRKEGLNDGSVFFWDKSGLSAQRVFTRGWQMRTAAARLFHVSKSRGSDKEFQNRCQVVTWEAPGTDFFFPFFKRGKIKV